MSFVSPVVSEAFCVKVSVGSSMLVRVAVVGASLLGLGVFAAAPAAAEDLNPEQARAFVVGKLFSYNCFEGTAGVGRIFADGSVVGTIRIRGQGQTRFAALPAGTIRVDSGSMCAHLSGLPISPCFRVEKLDYHSFRGSLSGMGFAYCDFHQRNPRSQLTSGEVSEPREATRAETRETRTVERVETRPVEARPLEPPAAMPVANTRPVLRPSLSE
jgi:hypothetical protein